MTAHSLFIAKNNRTLGDTVTNELREAIISGKLAPGTPLGQEKLAAEFGISRVPIREALRVLSRREPGHSRIAPRRHGGAAFTGRARRALYHHLVCGDRGGSARRADHVGRVDRHDGRHHQEDGASPERRSWLVQAERRVAPDDHATVRLVVRREESWTSAAAISAAMSPTRSCSRRTSRSGRPATRDCWKRAKSAT